MAVKLAGLGNLRLQVLEFDRRYEDTNTVRVTCRIALITPSIETVDIDNFECGDQCKLLHPHRVNAVSVDNSRQNLQVLVQRAEHEKGLA